MAIRYQFKDRPRRSSPITFLGAWQQQSARTPLRFRERLINLFRSPQNLDYLRALFSQAVPPGPLRAFALDTLTDSVYSYEQGEDLIYSDPVAQRGASRPAASLWAELRRINRTFYEYRMQFLRDKASLIMGKTTDGQWDDEESYHYRMLVADSLRPPGLENLNGAGPLYGIRETQTVDKFSNTHDKFSNTHDKFSNTHDKFSNRDDVGDPGVDKFSNRDDVGDPGVDPEDWSGRGNPNRTPEQAIAEYWGDDRVETTAMGEFGKVTYNDRYGQGPRWRESGGTRFMRYPTIPRWQNLSRGREYERDIDETLGTGSREMDNHVRRWDMSRMRNPRGEEYRHYGWRNDSSV